MPPESTKDKSDVFGIQFDRLTETQAIQGVLNRLSRGQGGRIITPNLSILRRAEDDDRLDFINGFDVVVCDGFPLRVLARWVSTPLPERVAGSSLIFSLSSAAAENGYSVYLLGGPPGVATAAAAELAARYPRLKLAGASSPPFGFDRDSQLLRQTLSSVAMAQPDVVFVGFGFPKQEIIATELASMLPASWFLCCGAAIEMLAGTKKRAPFWVQRLGLEWLFRLSQEPRRLTGRYSRDALFLLRLMARALRVRIRRHSST